MTCSTLFGRSIGAVPIDVVISEKHTSSLEVAEHPIEGGGLISDHAWRKPRKVTIEGAIASMPAMSAWEALLAVQEAREPIDIVTGLKLYDSMVIKELTAERDQKTSRILSFTAELQEVIIVQSQEGEGTGDSSDNQVASRTRQRGQVQARTSTNAEALANTYAAGRPAG